jgi:Mlc titration factor MtfA (ptsG expression regulator)
LNSFGNTLRCNPISHYVWQRATENIVVLQGLDAVQISHLRELTTWFTHRKFINWVHSLDVTLSMRVAVAARSNCRAIINQEACDET